MKGDLNEAHFSVDLKKMSIIHFNFYFTNNVQINILNKLVCFLKATTFWFWDC